MNIEIKNNEVYFRNKHNSEAKSKFLGGIYLDDAGYFYFHPQGEGGYADYVLIEIGTLLKKINDQNLFESQND